MSKRVLYRKNLSRLSGVRGKINKQLLTEMKKFTIVNVRNTGKSMSVESMFSYELHQNSLAVDAILRKSKAKMHNVQMGA